MSANFKPTLETYSGQGAFRFWCQKVLPLVYDDSLSYYELLNTVVNYLNNTISDVANMGTNIDDLLTAYTQLQNYVNEYFDNLDVQVEIDNKLDEMVENGTFNNLFNTVISNTTANTVQIWLNNNIGAVDETVLLDDSLTLPNAAATAKVVGDRFANEIAPLYNPSTTYGVGDYVQYNSALWRCNTAITTAEAWTPAHWTQVGIGNEVTELKSAFNVITENTKNLFLPENVMNAFINSSQVIATSTQGKLVYAKCKKNTTYTVSKAQGTRFSVAYINESPDLNVSVHGRSNDYTGTSITITTGSSAEYVVAWVYSAGTDAELMTAEEMLATVQIEEGSSATEYVPPYTAIDLTARNILETKAFQLKQITAGTDLNDIIAENGYYILALNSAYDNDPIGAGAYRFLRVFKSPSSPTYTIQIMYGVRSGKTYSRNYTSNTWSDWVSLSDSFISMQEFCGATATRTYCDHGGFFIWGNSTLENGLYENSPEAFKRARREGVMCQNMDIVFTADGVPIVMHDYQREDVNGDTFIFGQKTLAEIKATTFGDSEYEWTLMTLKEGVDLAMDLGRTYTIDVHGGTYNPTGSVESLANYMINNGIKPLSLVTSNATTFGRLLNAQNIDQFPLGIVITSSEEGDSAAIRNKIDLIKNAKTNLNLETACLAVTYSAYAYTNPSNYWFTPYVEECLQAGLSLSCYTINTNAQVSNPIPPYFDRVTSDRYNVPYERYIRTI